jgi:hypothetical protein
MRVGTVSSESIGAESSLVAARRGLLDLVDELKAIDIRTYEALEIDEQVRAVHPLAISLLERGVALVGLVVACSEPVRVDTIPPGLTFELTMDAVVSGTRPLVPDVGDIAFCAQLELRQRLHRLREVTTSRDAVALLGECDSALRRLFKGLCAIESALARKVGSEPLLDFTSELERSLRVRRCYARFTRKILELPPPTPETIVARLRAVGTAIAMLVGQDVYAELRMSDRLQLRLLQRRVLAWLRGAETRDAAGGLELFSDVTTFLDMLKQVNRRQELVEHDAALAGELLGSLGPGAPEVPQALLARLGALAGRDASIDGLLGSGQASDAAAWVSVLVALGYSRGGSDSGR